MQGRQAPKCGRKVVVVGAGSVGATFCYALSQSGLADEIALIDKNETLAQGQVLDLAHGQPFTPTVSVRVGSPLDYADAQVIVIAAGAAQQAGQTRLHLLQKNAAVVGGIAGDIANAGSAGVVIVVTNPVDVLTRVALKRLGWDRSRVMGSGTVLDTARLRHLLSAHCGVDIHNVHAYILGEHGDSEFAAWSMAHIAGMPIDNYCALCGRCDDWAAERGRLEQEVRDSAYHIIDYKGATYFAVGLALVRIVGAILRAENSVLSVSTLLEGEFDLKDVAISVPCIVSDGGVKMIIESALPERERQALSASAALLKRAFDQLEGR